MRRIDTSAYNAAIRNVPMPQRIKDLPVSEKGFPVPWFVAWIDGVPDFRVAQQARVAQAVRHKRCWICGQKLGRYFAFVVGPMCIINRTVSEPPSHSDCAAFAATACPFLVSPRMRRREAGLPEDRIPAPGQPIMRNPGAIAVWVTKSYEPFQAEGGALFSFGDPVDVMWFAEGREATRAEVQNSINSGLPLLREAAEQGGPEAVEELVRMTAHSVRYLPVEAPDGPNL
jgi:hypothetical protein